MPLADGVSFVAASSGTGTFVFASARTSYLTLAQAQTAGEIVDGQIVSYLAVDSLASPTQREWGHGTYSLSGNSIARTTVLGTMSGATPGTTALAFSVPPIVFLTALAEDINSAIVHLAAPLTLYINVMSGTIVGGTAYTAGSYGYTFVAGGGLSGAPIALTGGSGTGATANIIVTAGAVTDVIPVASGSGYQVGDVLSASAATIGGTGSGFTFTVTGIGNDINTGASPSTAFRTFTRAILEISKYNISSGFAVTVNVADGLYQEQPIFTAFVGAIVGQITWTGNVSKPTNCHLMPTTNRNDPNVFINGVISFLGTNGNTLQGFEFDNTGPGSGGWHLVGGSGGGENTIKNCYQRSGDGYFAEHYKIEQTYLHVSGTMSYEWGGVQGNWATVNNQANLQIDNSTTMTLLSTPAGAPSFLPYFFIETNQRSLVFIDNVKSNWTGWGGALGQRWSVQSGSKVDLLDPDPSTVPGSLPGSFAHNDVSYGSFSGPGAGFTFGATEPDALPILFQTPNMWGIFHVWFGNVNFPASGVPDAFFLSFSDQGTARNVPLSLITTGYNFQTPTTGFSLTLGNKDGRAILDPAGTLATGTITMCHDPFDGQEVEVRTSQTITALTVAANTGQTIIGNPSTLVAGKAFSAIYRLANTKWYCEA